MANLTQVAFSSGTLASSISGTVSTIDNTITAAGAPSATNVQTVQFSTTPNSSAVPIWAAISSGATVTLSSNPTVIQSSALTITPSSNITITPSSVYIVTVSSLTGGTVTTVGTVTSLTSGTVYVSGGSYNTLTYGVIAASGTNATNIKTASATLYSAHFYNNNTQLPRFVKLYNSSVAPTAGTTPAFTVGVPPGDFRDVEFAGAISSQGLGYTITGAAPSTDTTAVTSNDIIGVIEYV